MLRYSKPVMEDVTVKMLRYAMPVFYMEDATVKMLRHAMPFYCIEDALLNVEVCDASFLYGRCDC
jgi:hypothetical protein